MTESEAAPNSASESKPSMLKRAAIAAAGLGLVIQFVPNPFAVEANPEKRASLDAEPPEVVALLKRSCFDCHSNETKWPLYSKVAPVSWFVAHDVAEGRDFLNFSNWDEMDDDEKYYARETAADLAESGEMPLQVYIVPFHLDAKLSDADKALLRKWFDDNDV